MQRSSFGRTKPEKMAPSMYKEKLSTLQGVMSMSREEIEKYNSLAMMSFNKEVLSKCENCNRQFTKDKLQ